MQTTAEASQLDATSDYRNNLIAFSTPCRANLSSPNPVTRAGSTVRRCVLQLHVAIHFVAAAPPAGGPYLTQTTRGYHAALLMYNTFVNPFSSMMLILHTHPVPAIRSHEVAPATTSLV
jgi:hypothetical protein